MGQFAKLSLFAFLTFIAVFLFEVADIWILRPLSRIIDSFQGLTLILCMTICPIPVIAVSGSFLLQMVIYGFLWALYFKWKKKRADIRSAQQSAGADAGHAGPRGSA